MTTERPTCAKRVSARHTPKLMVPCSRNAEEVDQNGKGWCWQHKPKRKPKWRRDLAQAEAELLEHVVRTGQVDKSLWMLVTTLRADEARWKKENEHG